MHGQGIAIFRTSCVSDLAGVFVIVSSYTITNHRKCTCMYIAVKWLYMQQLHNALYLNSQPEQNRHDSMTLNNLSLKPEQRWQ